MKIAVIMLEYQEYEHLDDLNKIFGNKSKHDFKIFGTCFDFWAIKKCRDKHDFGSDEMVGRGLVQILY